jgi:hypothetical protein
VAVGLKPLRNPGVIHENRTLMVMKISVKRTDNMNCGILCYNAM